MPIVVKAVTNARDVTCFANSQTPQGVVFKLQPIWPFGLNCSTTNNVQGFRRLTNTVYSIVVEGDVVIFRKFDHYHYKCIEEGVVYHDVVDYQYTNRKEGFVIYHDVVHYRLRYQTRGWGRGRGARGGVVVEP